MQTFYTITTRSIQILRGCSAPTARKELYRVREILQLKKNESLMLRDLAAVWNCEARELAEELYLNCRKLAA
jgi:hypothetical protein